VTSFGLNCLSPAVQKRRTIATIVELVAVVHQLPGHSIDRRPGTLGFVLCRSVSPHRFRHLGQHNGITSCADT